MKCRNYVNNEIVFFGSKGVIPQTEYAEIDLNDENSIIPETKEMQNFKIVGIGENGLAEIQFLNTNNTIFYQTNITSENNEVRGVLTQPLSTINVISNTFDDLRLYLYPYQLKDSSNSFVDNQSAVATSLTQRLNIIRGELWYKVSFGLPLYEKISKKIEMDAAVLQIVNEHPDVISVNNFNSVIIKHTYSCSMTIKSKYGELELSI